MLKLIFLIYLGLDKMIARHQKMDKPMQTGNKNYNKN